MYIADKQITLITPIENQKIPSSTVVFEDGTEAIYTDKSLSYNQSEESLDPSQYSDLIEFHIVEDLITVCEAHDVEAGRINRVVQMLAQSIKNKEMQAYAIAFGIQGDDPAEIKASKVRLSDFRRILGE